MKRGEGSRPSRPFPTSNRVSSLHALLPRPPPYVSHAFGASNPVSSRRRAARPSTSSGGRHSTASTRFASSPILLPPFQATPVLPWFVRFVFPRVFCRSTSADVVLSVVASFVSSQLWFSSFELWFSTVRGRNREGSSWGSPRIQCGVLLAMFPTVFPVFPSRPGYGYEDGGNEGARDRGYGRTVFPGLPFRMGKREAADRMRHAVSPFKTFTCDSQPSGVGLDCPNHGFILASRV